MEPIEFITPNKYKVFIKPRLTFGEYNQIKSAIKKEMKIEFGNISDPKDATKNMKLQPISVEALSGTNDIALKILVTKVTDSNDVDLGDPTTAIENMPIEDGDAVYEKINEITSNADVSKKKGI